jgi:hypothetical protein
MMRSRTLFALSLLSVTFLSVATHADDSGQMTKQKILKMVEAYNSEDFMSFAEYHTEDFTYIHYPDRDSAHWTVIEGRDNVLNFFGQGHGRLKEVMTFHNILIDGDQMAVEIDAVITFKEDYPDYYAGPFLKGDVRHIKWAAFFEIEDGKIKSVKKYNLIGGA